MEKPVTQRIMNLMHLEKISQIEFARRTKLNKATVNNYLKKSTEPKFNALNKILLAFPKMNARWFITGEGNFSESDANLSVVNEPGAVYQTKVQSLQTENENLKQIIELQKRLLCEVEGHKKTAC